ncbi:LytTR family DNA-binding domain-containing protein [Aeribacillus pallidus]|uniref:LytR/AlgR family response regulator transcription factor n=1 Tax=Aeribacillus TaxID=1055323 RepID=UPI0007B45E93|nr:MULTISPECIES: LytTR family DNA-binding domain-containing protein [Aeribacillus]KZM57789.1 DNA-binding response regulator [Aeribacillus pallidus]MED0649827.1 LytTR family DNA-binding domain-containing protein [Aeribacillus composti]MED0717129.1 LytTR family DNA-binding domain-containing protein [Aeribacillus composti]MED0746816.1 LytTR family DNA-binding domain-containing protein [Aeribacillus composti]MED1438794.1 LytTR family DNA-binding domain-containing protein [Aeribacillus composti]
MIKAFIVEDEPLARDELIYLLKRSKQVEIVGEAEQMDEAIEKIRQTDMDVIFLDIQLSSHEQGIRLAEKLMEIDHRPEIVFATAYDEYALKAFELNAVDYILKPFDEERIFHTIEKISKRLEARQEKRPQYFQMQDEKIPVSLDDRILLINVKDILYIEFNDGKTIITCRDQKYEVKESLVTFERKLQQTHIMRVHRAYLVNLNEIVEIQPWFNSTYHVIMKNGDSIPVSRTYTKELKKRLGI